MIGLLSGFQFFLFNAIITLGCIGYFLFSHPEQSYAFGVIYIFVSFPTFIQNAVTWWQQNIEVQIMKEKVASDLEQGDVATQKEEKIFTEAMLLQIVFVSNLGPLVMLICGVLMINNILLWQCAFHSITTALFLCAIWLIYVSNDVSYFYNKILLGRI
jgi:hypothetical protein